MADSLSALQLTPESAGYADKLVQLLRNLPVDAQLEALGHQLSRFQASVDEESPERFQTLLNVFERVALRLGIEDEYGEWFVRTFTNTNDFGSGVDGAALKKCPCANCDEEEGTGCSEEGTYRCSICGLVKYCGSSCQKMHWVLHKKNCKESSLAAKTWRPSWEQENRPAAWQGPVDTSTLPKAIEGRYVWGTYPAVDLLRWRSADDFQSEVKELGRTRICLPASGDLRHLIRTVNNLPDEYDLPLEIHVNDREPFVVSRNWLILLLLFCKGVDALDSVIAVWYSSQLTLQQISAIQLLLLDEDVSADTTQTNEVKTTWTSGKSTLRTNFVENNGDIEPLVYLSGMAVNEVTSEDAEKTRNNVMLHPKRKDFLHKFLLHLQPFHREAANRFRQDGLLLPFGALHSQHTAPNRFILHPAFGWMVPDSADPLQGWPLEEVFSFAESQKLPSNDIYGNLFFYLRDQLNKFVSKLEKHDITINLYCEDAQDLVQRFYPPRSGNRPLWFDRIDASSLADSGNLGLKKTLELFSPLLSPANPSSTMITMFEMWSDAEKSKNELADVAEREINRRSGSGKVDPRQAFNEMQQDGRMTPIVKLFDHYQPFCEFLEKEGAQDISRNCGIVRRSVHRIVPPRLFVPIDSDQHATLESLPSDYNVLSLSNCSLFERFAEWTRTSLKNLK